MVQQYIELFREDRESYNDLLDDMNRLLIGGDGAIKIVILVKWTKDANNSVSGPRTLQK
jgi:hypothetical protein